MDGQTSIYTEKKLAYYEASYKTSMIAKPQEVNLTLTAAHIYGLAYICDQTGTKEDDPIYTRFSCGLDEITRIYINENVKTSPLYIQCDESSKGITNRRRIIIPCLDHVSQIVEAINNAKHECDQKASKQKQLENERKLKDIESNKQKDIPNEPNDDPVKYVAEFLSSSEHTPVHSEEEYVQKKSVLPKLKKDFDFESNEKISEEKTEVPFAAEDAVMPEAITDTEENVTVKPKEIFDIDDAISEILDNLSPEIGFSNSSDSDKVDSQQNDPDAYGEIETADDNLYSRNSFEDAADVAEIAVPISEEPAVSQRDIYADMPKKEMSLDEFEKSVKKLKTMLDNNVIDEDEFSAEKKKLIANLY